MSSNDSDEQSGAVSQSGYPRRRRNPFLRSMSVGKNLNKLQLPFFMILPPKGFGVLTTTGRKTGRARRNCVRAIRDGQKIYLVMVGPSIYNKPRDKATADWLRNIRVNPSVRLRTRTGTVEGKARELVGQAESERLRQRYCGTINAFDFIECRFFRPGFPSRQKIRALHTQWCTAGIPVVIDLI